MKLNQKCLVSSFAPFHANRIGYFQFFGEGSSKNTIVLADKPYSSSDGGRVMFAVSRENIEVITKEH
jgi:hypothetical protein